MTRTFGEKSAHWPAVLLFALLSLGMTYPLVFHLADHVPSDLGDPLYNIWVLAWNFHKFTTGLGGFWDANIFFPHHGTLLYADSLVGLSVIAAPFLALGIPLVVVYNMLFLASFFLAGLGMYALVVHLSKSREAAALAGMVFAFFPYHFAHISHLELLFMAWMPFCFLAIHRFFERPSYPRLLAIGLFFVLQASSCAYYGVHLALFGVLLALFLAWRTRLLFKRSFWIRAGVLTVCLLAVLGPIFYPYVKVHSRMLFIRSIGAVEYYSAGISDYLSVPSWNRLWGRIAGSSSAQEWQLYPGLIPVFLSLALFVLRPGKKSSAAVQTSGDSSRPAQDSLPFYVFLAVLAFLLSLGPAVRISPTLTLPGPYRLLYSWVPGFQGLRVPSRLSVVMMLGLAVISGTAAARWIARVRPRWAKRALPVVLGGLILADFLSIPIPLAQLEFPQNIPVVYSTVRGLPEGAPLIEFPIPPRGQAKSREALYLYYSAFHWKRLVNGYSGYIPPGYTIIGEAMQDFPSRQTFGLLRDLGVEYLLVHTEWFMGAEGKRIKAGLDVYQSDAELMSFSAGDFLYRLIPRPGRPEAGSPLPEIGDRRRWTARSNCGSELTSLAFDGNPETGWSTGRPQAEGDYFELDLGEILRLGEVDFSLNKKPLDYPRGYKLEGSQDGTSWEILNESSFYFPRLTPDMIEDYSKYRVEISFEPRPIRYLRLTSTLEHKSRPWSIQEIVCRGGKTNG